MCSPSTESSRIFCIVHTHSSQAAWVGGLAARLAGTPAILHTAHGFALDEGSHPLLLWFYTLHERLAARWRDRIVMMSDFHRRWALRLGIGGPAQDYLESERHFQTPLVGRARAA